MIYKKKVKKHEEVWINDGEYGEARVRVCVGNSNYARLFYYTSEDSGQWLTEEETKEAFKLFAEIWADNVDNHPFSE